MKQMKHMKRFNKRLLSAALALVMALTLLPANLPVLATADGAADVTERAVDNRPYDGPDDSSAPVDGPAGLDGETNAVDDGETAGDPDPADPDGDAADDTGETPGGNETGDPDPADPDGDAADDTGETPDGNETGEAPDEDTPADEADATGGEQADPDAADDAWAPEPVAETDPAAALESQISFVAENTEKFLRTIDPIDVDSSWTAVSDVAGLKALAGAARNTKFYLTNDIDLAGEEWVPIKDFKGIFDGQGYVIRNLTITGSVDDFEVFNIKILVGLFADGGNLAYDDAIIRNVGLEGTKIDVTSSVDQALRVGALWADPGGAQIINCYNEGDVSAKNDSRDVIVGGICGHADYTTIEACKNSGSVAAYSETWGAEAGGICGEGGGTSGDNRWIDGCENYSTVAAETVAGATVRDAQAGGITGTNGYVRNSRNYGGVTAKTGTDGTTEASYALVGGISGSNGKQISNCINEGAISAEVNSRTPSHQARAGGIVGNISSIKEGIDTCTNKGAVTARASGKASARAGGICGEQGIFSGLVISGCVNEGAVLAVSAEPHDGLRAGPSAGGILGAAERTGDDITIEQSTNKGAVTARATGGARAYAGDTSSRKLTITAGCHNEGDVTAAALDKSNAYAHEFYAFFCGLGDKAEYVVINAESCTRHTHKQGTVREIALTVPTAAAKPAITTQPVSVTVELDATEGNTLTVAASSPDGGVLSYQWHQNNTNSASGGWAISGATGASYTAPTEVSGTYFYYCVVTNYNEEVANASKQRATATSAVARVVVRQPAAAALPSIATLGGATIQVKRGEEITVKVKLENAGSAEPVWYFDGAQTANGDDEKTVFKKATSDVAEGRHVITAAITVEGIVYRAFAEAYVYAEAGAGEDTFAAALLTNAVTLFTQRKVEALVPVRFVGAPPAEFLDENGNLQLPAAAEVQIYINMGKPNVQRTYIFEAVRIVDNAFIELKATAAAKSLKNVNIRIAYGNTDYDLGFLNITVNKKLPSVAVLATPLDLRQAEAPSVFAATASDGSAVSITEVAPRNANSAKLADAINNPAGSGLYGLEIGAASTGKTGTYAARVTVKLDDYKNEPVRAVNLSVKIVDSGTAAKAPGKADAISTKGSIDIANPNSAIVVKTNASAGTLDSVTLSNEVGDNISAEFEAVVLGGNTFLIKAKAGAKLAPGASYRLRVDLYTNGKTSSLPVAKTLVVKPTQSAAKAYMNKKTATLYNHVPNRGEGLALKLTAPKNAVLGYARVQGAFTSAGANFSGAAGGNGFELVRGGSAGVWILRPEGGQAIVPVKKGAAQELEKATNYNVKLELWAVGTYTPVMENDVVVGITPHSVRVGNKTFTAKPTVVTVKVAVMPEW